MKTLPFNAQQTIVSAATTAAAKSAISAVTGTRHRILGLVASSAAAQNITLQSSTGGRILGPIYLAAGVPAVLPHTAYGYGASPLSRGVYVQHDAAAATATLLTYVSYSATA